MPTEGEHPTLQSWLCRIGWGGNHLGTGMLIGADLVLTCRHVMAPILQRVRAANAGVDDILRKTTISVGLNNPTPRTLKIKAAHLAGPPGGVYWPWCIISSDSAPGEGGGERKPPDLHPNNLDFAVLQLDRPVQRNIDPDPPYPWMWINAHGIGPRTDVIIAGSGEIFAYHFPKVAGWQDEPAPVFTTGVLTGRTPGRKRLLHGLELSPGSSGAILFHQTAEGMLPLAMHNSWPGVAAGEAADDQTRSAVPLPDIITQIQGAAQQLGGLARAVLSPLYTRIASGVWEPVHQKARHDDFGDRPEDCMNTAYALMDREGEADTLILAREKRLITPMLCRSQDLPELFVDRLRKYALPYGVLTGYSVKATQLLSMDGDLTAEWLNTDLRSGPPVNPQVFVDSWTMRIEKELAQGGPRLFHGCLFLNSDGHLQNALDILQGVDKFVQQIGSAGKPPFHVLCVMQDDRSASAGPPGGSTAELEKWREVVQRRLRSRKVQRLQDPDMLIDIAQGQLRDWQEFLVASYGIDPDAINAAVSAAFAAEGAKPMAAIRNHLNPTLTAYIRTFLESRQEVGT